MKRRLASLMLVCMVASVGMTQGKGGQKILAKTYCNPIDLSYAYVPSHGRENLLDHRATADPVIVRFNGDYYLFSTNQEGYWWSADMGKWTFIKKSFLNDGDQQDDVVAPAAWVMDGQLYVTGSDIAANHPIFRSKDPKSNQWEKVVPGFKATGIDPCFFVDDDKRVYVYHNSSNSAPTYGMEVDPKTWEQIGERKDMIRLDPDHHGWERFGEGYDNVFLAPFIEGSWMTKHAGKYYLQYAAPGTEFSGYADGVYVGDHPLGPFTYQGHNPFSLHAGGFARGAGHGATYQDAFGNWWHVGTVAISVKNNFERRVGIWPAGFDADGILYCNQAYGDYPTRLPDGESDHQVSRFMGWMLLNYAKPVTVSSTLGSYVPNFAVDEDIKSYWSARTDQPGEWIKSDLGEVSTINAVQINYADQDATLKGIGPGRYYQYRLESSVDGKHWKTIEDKSKGHEDAPHDYIELARPVRARYVRLTNIHVPSGKFAISGLRVFGQGQGAKPKAVTDFISLRASVVKPGDPPSVADRRSTWLKWKQNDLAMGYTVYFGIAPDKLYSSVMVYGGTEYIIRTLDVARPYYFQIEAFNENGIGAKSAVIKSE